MQEPPVQPDYHALSGNYHLSPTRSRHDKIAIGGSHW
ncbi:replication initiation protein [Salmonella enterica subsp. enterica serovar Braenderup]|nr:replication initiation protein [Citrobacter youngae]